MRGGRSQALRDPQFHLQSIQHLGKMICRLIGFHDAVILFGRVGVQLRSHTFKIVIDRKVFSNGLRFRGDEAANWYSSSQNTTKQLNLHMRGRRGDFFMGTEKVIHYLRWKLTIQWATRYIV